MITFNDEDKQLIKQALDGGMIFTFQFGGEIRILQKIGAFYSLYEPSSTWQTPETVSNALHNLVIWHQRVMKQQADTRRYIEPEPVAVEKTA